MTQAPSPPSPDLDGLLAVCEGDKPSPWKKFADEQPASGAKIIAPYDDGSGAGMFFIHDDGVIDQDGDEYPRVPRGPNDVWAYLPSGYEFYCESYPEEAVTLPEWIAPEDPTIKALILRLQQAEGDYTETMKRLEAACVEWDGWETRATTAEAKLKELESELDRLRLNDAS